MALKQYWVSEVYDELIVVKKSHGRHSSASSLLEQLLYPIQIIKPSLCSQNFEGPDSVT